MSIIFLSCCISFITIFILFYRKKNHTKIQIPTWFLGSTYKLNFKKNIILTKPPIIPLFLIILATMLAGYIYFPREQNTGKIESNKYLLLWLDPSLSAKLSRLQSQFSAQEEAKKINALGYKIYGLSNDFLIQNGKPTINYHIENINSEQNIKKFILTEEKKPPSPFTQSLNYQQVSKFIESYPDFSQKKGTFLIYSDGKESSMFGAFLLKNYFNNGTLIKTPPFYGQANTSQEIIQNNHAFLHYDEKNNFIPEYTRPHLFKSTYQFKDKNISLIEQKLNKSSLPLLFACIDISPGFIELDPFASIRELAKFFGSTIIEKNCKTENTMNYRSGAIWLIPLSEAVLSSLDNDFKFWTPKNFNLNTDTLVYIAPSFNENSQLTHVQLDKNSYPLSLYLSPPPPVSEIAYKDPQESFSYSGKFKPVFLSENNVPLAWKSSTLPFFYLRTAASTVNAELNRSNKWIHFWFDVAKTVKNGIVNFTVIESNDINNKDFAISQLEGMTESLNPDTLQFTTANTLTPGLYKLQNNSLVLIKNNLNTQEKIVTETEFASNFNLDTHANSQNEHNTQPSFIYFAFILFAISLLLLWYMQARENKE